MRFKGRYFDETGTLSLGPFYDSDIRKLTALALKRPFMISDDIARPREFYRGRLKAPETLFMTGRIGKEVTAYLHFEHVQDRVMMLHPHMQLPLPRHPKKQMLGVISLAIAYAFKELGVNRLVAGSMSVEPSTVKLIEALGFVLEGTLREALFYGNKPYDVNLHSILRREFETWHH